MNDFEYHQLSLKPAFALRNVCALLRIGWLFAQTAIPGVFQLPVVRSRRSNSCALLRNVMFARTATSGLFHIAELLRRRHALCCLFGPLIER